MDVWVLTRTFQKIEGDDRKVLGVYASENDAKEAAELYFAKYLDKLRTIDNPPNWVDVVHIVKWEQHNNIQTASTSPNIGYYYCIERHAIKRVIDGNLSVDETVDVSGKG